MIARTLLDAALGYAESKGWHLFPLLGKKPHPGIARVAEAMGKDGHLTGKWGATNDHEVLRAYFDAMPDATGIGLLCGPESGVDALDIDGEKGRATLRGLGYTIDDLKALGVPMVRTGRDGEGFHAYFIADPQRRVTSKTGKGERGGLDAKGGGAGYVVLPPSVHPHTGRAYAWEQQGVPQPWPAAILEAVTKKPEAAPLLEQPKEQASRGMRFKGKPVLERALEYVALIPGAVSGEGGHDATLNVACRAAIDFGLGGEDVLTVLKAYNARCSPPWSDKELLHKVESALKRAAVSPDKGRALKSDKPKEAAQGEEAAPPLRFFTPAEILAMAEAKPREWLVDGLLPFGAVVLVTGVEKEAGKSSFVWSLVGAAERGDEFIGKVLPKTGAVVLTEESVWDVAEKLRGYGVTRSPILPQGEAWGVSMERAVDEAIRAAQKTGARILVVDTFAAWAALEGDAENKAGAAQALKPLQRARDAGLLVLLIHHTNKNKDAEGIRRNRGSTALTGAVEASLEVMRYSDTARVLRLVSRYAGSKSWLVDRTRNEAGLLTYKFLGDKVAVQKTSTEDAVVEWMSKNPGWHTKDKIALRVPGQSAQVRGAVLQLVRDGKLQRSGEGKSGSPYLYAMPGEAEPTSGQVEDALADEHRTKRNASRGGVEDGRASVLKRFPRKRGEE